VWKEKPLLDVVTLYNGLTYTPNDIRDRGTLVLRSSNVQEGEISLLDNVYVRSEVATSPNVEKGDIIVVVRNGSRALIGKHAQIKTDMPNTVIGAFMAGMHTDEPEFMNALLCTSRFDNEVTINLGATINQITNGTFRSMKFLFPDKKEQKALGAYFQYLDSLIQSTTKRVESIKQVKTACLQSMFPQEGETIPRVRFKGFEGEWEKVTLGDCLIINNERNHNNVYGINDVLSVSDEVGVVNQIKLLGRSYAGKSVSNYRVLKTNQIVYTKSPLKSKPYGIVKVNKGSVGIVSVLYAVYDTKENVCPDYIHYYFEPTDRINNYLLPLINKGAKNTMNISDEMALTGSIWIPSFKEQQKIADFLQILDTQITLQSHRLEKLKQIKSACLDNMFV
jgi:type I restriction enzyme S subunit